MKPLPKWMAWVSMAGTIGAALTMLGGALPPKLGTLIISIGSVLTSLSHSLPGTGGAPTSDK